MKKYNVLIPAGHVQTALQAKAINAVLDKAISDEDWDGYLSFKVSEFIPEESSVGKDNRVSLQKQMKEITQAGFLLSNDEEEMVLVVVDAVKHHRNTGTFTLRASRTFQEMANSLLAGGFSTLPLEEIRELTGKYSIPLYGLLKQKHEQFSHKSYIFAQMSLDELRFLLAIPSNGYPRFNTFREKVIEPAVKEILARTNIAFEVEYLREGRKVTGVLFKGIKSSNAQVESLLEQGASTIDSTITALGAKPEVVKPVMVGLERGDLLTVEFFRYVGEQIESNETEVKAVTPWLMAALPDIILRYDKKKAKIPKEVKNKSKNVQSERESALKRAEKELTAPVEHEKAVKAWEREPKAVKELIRAQMASNGGSFHFLSDVEVYKILKERVSYDSKTNIAVLQEDLYEHKTKGTSIPK